MASSSDETIDVENPATEQLIAPVRSATAADVDVAMTAARSALPGCAHTTVAQRAGYLRADGAILSWLSDTDVPTVAARVGRGSTLAARIFAAPSEDVAAVRKSASRVLAGYPTAPVYRAFRNGSGAARRSGSCGTAATARAHSMRSRIPSSTTSSCTARPRNAGRASSATRRRRRHTDRHAPARRHEHPRGRAAAEPDRWVTASIPTHPDRLHIADIAPLS